MTESAECKRSIDINPFFQEAQAFVLQIQKKIPLKTAILDDWNTGEGIQGGRIIYGISSSSCEPDCSDCLLLRAVGEDGYDTQLMLRTSLCKASKNQLALFPSKQKYLNCKTMEEYKEAFIACILEECTSEELLKAELDWVSGFRILFYKGNYDIDFLKEKERESKIFIVEEVLRKLRLRDDLQRINIISEYQQQKQD